MKILILFIIAILVSFNASAKTVCSMTFNSPDEKQVFSKNLAPAGYSSIELVPSNKDPHWFSKACAQATTCDILVISGHFGGLFFGEQSSATISLNELLNAKEQGLCPNILDKPKAVYLMGCNTLSSKSPDHRSVNDYLRVLVGDGFPLNLAEDVAAARYLNFGSSMLEQMSSVFNHSQMLVGFESTGPLGAQAAPRLQTAFKNSSTADKNVTGISKTAILAAFNGTNLRVVKPDVQNVDNLKIDALSNDSNVSHQAWQQILSPDSITRNYDFIVKNQNNIQLAGIINGSTALKKLLGDKLLAIYKAADGLSAIQIRVLIFLKLHSIITYYTFENSILSISKNIIFRGIDYIGADQLCSILKDNKDIAVISKFDTVSISKLNQSPYGSYLYKCAGFDVPKQAPSKSLQCLTSRSTYDWACLTENPKDLDIDACTLAKSRNLDPENADDMMWFCYSNMRDNKYLSRPACLELTHNFSLLGNQIKMNWNCLNRL